jgi:death on curing protein
VSRSPREPRWVSRAVAVAIQADQIRHHGGTHGVRDVGLLDSALHRAPNRWHYEQTGDLLLLGATYCVAIARNHPFLDGNKRAAFQVMYVFLGLNGRRIVAEEAEVVDTMLRVATGEVDESALAQWLEAHVVER